MMKDRQNHNAFWLGLEENAVGKAIDDGLTHFLKDDRKMTRSLLDTIERHLNLGYELASEIGLLLLVPIGRVVEFGLSRTA